MLYRKDICLKNIEITGSISEEHEKKLCCPKKTRLPTIHRNAPSSLVGILLRSVIPSGKSTKIENKEQLQI